MYDSLFRIPSIIWSPCLLTNKRIERNKHHGNSTEHTSTNNNLNTEENSKLVYQGYPGYQGQQYDSGGQGGYPRN
jgi:hypothetical protein